MTDDTTPEGVERHQHLVQDARRRADAMERGDTYGDTPAALRRLADHADALFAHSAESMATNDAWAALLIEERRKTAQAERERDEARARARNPAMIDTTPEGMVRAEMLAREAAIAARALADQGYFETGQAIFNECAATLRALSARLAEVEAERDRLKRQHDALRDQMTRAIEDAHEARARVAADIRRDGK